eukprot:gene17599-23930_t
MSMTYPDANPKRPARIGYFRTMLSSRDIGAIGAKIVPMHEPQYFGMHRLEPDEDGTELAMALDYVSPIQHMVINYEAALIPANEADFLDGAELAMALHYVSSIQHMVINYEAALIAANETEFLVHDLGDKLRQEAGVKKRLENSARIWSGWSISPDELLSHTKAAVRSLLGRTNGRRYLRK